MVRDESPHGDSCGVKVQLKQNKTKQNKTKNQEYLNVPLQGARGAYYLQ
jgi:hypothetical protein